jgi:hypothetical protein
MTKLHYQYNDSSSSIVVAIKQVDYAKKTVKNITFQSQAQYLATTLNATQSFTLANYFLGDNYLVLRTKNVEEAYQFLSGTLIYLRTRTLSTAEANCYRTFIDSYYSDNLIVLDLYDNGNSTDHGYFVYSFSYGNLASTIKIVPAAIPAYISFPPPTSTSHVAYPSAFEWIFVNSGTTNSTITIYRQDDSVSSTHLASQTISIFRSNCAIVAASKNCFIFKSGSSYSLYNISSSPYTSADITSQVGTIGNSTIVQISNDCSKFRVNSNIFAKFNGLFQQTNANTISFIALDQSFTYALANSAMWKYTSASNSYQNYYNNASLAFSTGSMLQSNNGNIIAYQLGSSNSHVTALVDNGITLTILLNTTVSGYSSAPKIAISPLLSLVVVYGASGNTPIINFYSIDYINEAFTVLNFPSEAVFDPSSLYVILEK